MGANPAQCATFWPQDWHDRTRQTHSAQGVFPYTTPAVALLALALQRQIRARPAVRSRDEIVDWASVRESPDLTAPRRSSRLRALGPWLAA